MDPDLALNPTWQAYMDPDVMNLKGFYKVPVIE
jgi:hypothetical protein